MKEDGQSRQKKSDKSLGLEVRERMDKCGMELTGMEEECEIWRQVVSVETDGQVQQIMGECIRGKLLLSEREY